SHFLEHLMFKGTKRRPTTLEISKTLDGIGAEYNAFTSKDYTGYFIKASAEKSDLLLDMLSDMLYNSLLDPAEIDRERGVILEEINMYEDNPLMYLEDVFEQLVYGKETPLGQLIAGPRKNIRNVSRREIVAYRKKHYTEANMVVIVAGRMNVKAIEKRIGIHFLTSGKRSPKKRTPKPLVMKGGTPHVRVIYRKTEQTQIGLGFPAYSHFDKRIHALHLMSVILGGNMSSRLFIRIRERLGLCYMIRTSVNPYEDTGTFYIQSGLDRGRIALALEKILDELKLLRNEGVTQEELQHAKEYFRGKLVLNLEDSEAVANWIGMQELLLGKAKTPEQRMREIDAVTVKDVLEVAQNVIRRSRLNLAVIGPYRDASLFRKIMAKSL
ncbi:MAG: insulinase family protein, partial [Candidatus Kerfeldbacteria bacterium]|nr:insulinase family protein [Candidatus Kerfeldbacteria bacterium]